ncbi:hypothetical protein ALC57_02495 [Trachymyrmex cornetzi]|uniref:Uncharacterized protein n=1 Tax=Trachymyrmex cornetzi TaxID=471704 RepID=A0A195EJK0_9HYME|nr:hypothetical protein ALC57_02495 [Trachymyrmex cornetzi]
MSIAISQRRQPPFMRFLVRHPQTKPPSRIVRVDSRRSPVGFDGDESRVSCQKSWRVLINLFYRDINTKRTYYLYDIVEITSAAGAIHFHRRGGCTPDYINKHRPAVGPQGVEILDSAQPR